MCTVFAPATCPAVVHGGIRIATALTDWGVAEVSNALVDTLLGALAAQVTVGIKAMVGVLAAWVVVPSTDVCPAGGTGVPAGTAGFVSDCLASDYPAAVLRRAMLPVTAIVAVCAIAYQGVVMAVSRRGEPLLQVIRGLWLTALWGAVGIAGTEMALRAGDSWAVWILGRSVLGDSAKPPNETFAATLGALLAMQPGTTALLVILLGVLVVLVLLAQVLLMVFREGAVVILAGLLQLAAAGSFTRGTSPWLAKVTGWMLALVAYKPMAATVYAVAFMLMASPDGSGRNFVIGLAVIGLAIVALPVLLKFFTWTVGATQTHGGGLGMLGSTAAAGVHAAASLRSVGGASAGEHARYLADHGPGSGATGSGATGRAAASGAAGDSPAVASGPRPSHDPTARGGTNHGSAGGAPDQPAKVIDGVVAATGATRTAAGHSGGVTAAGTAGGAAPAAAAGPSGAAVVAATVAVGAGRQAAGRAADAVAAVDAATEPSP